MKQNAKRLPSFPQCNRHEPRWLDFAFLQEEGVESADLFVACTQSQETNILSAALAQQAGCKQVIALVSDEGCFLF